MEERNYQKLTREYNKIIIALNWQIVRFNQQLSKTEIKTLPLEYTRDSYLALSDMDWKKDKWPNAEKNGVYFAFGLNGQGKHALYIGKASMSSSIGLRLQSHFADYAHNRPFRMGSKEEAFEIVLVASIPLEDNISFFAPALEEFLIHEIVRMKNELDFLIINKTGKQ